jgi:hypothetical protein
VQPRSSTHARDDDHAEPLLVCRNQRRDGKHRLHVELVTSAHREFAPPALTDETITVSGIGPLPQLPDCPRAPRAMP